MTFKVLVIGGSGMLGAQVVSYLSTLSDFKISATVRTVGLAATGRTQLPNVDWHSVKLGTISDVDSLRSTGQFDWVINAVGATNRVIEENDIESVYNAVRINVSVPVALAEYADDSDAQVFQIATDCVYSGSKGSYVESDPHDALDVYGKTKSLGEVPHPRMHHLRCSIIGPEPKERKFLLEWLLAQPRGAKVSGYSDHFWNGVTTLQFARVAAGIIRSGIIPPAKQHLVPADMVTKAELLRIIADAYDRDDLEIEDQPTGSKVDRTLGSETSRNSDRLWFEAGYPQPPTIADMVQELSKYKLSLDFES